MDAPGNREGARLNDRILEEGCGASEWVCRVCAPSDTAQAISVFCRSSFAHGHQSPRGTEPCYLCYFSVIRLYW